jgi:ribosomal RNA-processing protein 1
LLPTPSSLISSAEKKVRDKALRILSKWLAGRRTMGLPEMLKLWKALYFAMWHADKTPVQQELAGRLAGLLAQVPTELMPSFASAFFITMRREWHTIDRLRLDKFYSLIRRFLCELFVCLRNCHWDIELCDSYACIAGRA